MTRELMQPWAAGRVAFPRHAAVGVHRLLPRMGRLLVERFRANKWVAARAYWDELRAGIAEAFAAGPDAIKDQRAPGPGAKVDMMANK